jgi:tripartite-type tricarboxylate transporter receptor subunit TctC
MHVPYKGGSVALLNILSGEVDMVVVTVPATIPFIESKRLRALAVLSPERAPALPGVPTSAQAGMPELQFVTWYGLAGPVGMNPEFVARLNAETVRILQSPEEKQRLTKVGIDAATSTPVAFADYMRAEVSKWSRVIRETKIQINE